MKAKAANRKRVEDTSRYDELKQVLMERRTVLKSEVQGQIRDTRADGEQGRDVIDQVETSLVETEGEIQLAVLQMKADQLKQIEAALIRLEGGRYGNCVDCGNEIEMVRLRALPFASRCRVCEEKKEAEEE